MATRGNWSVAPTRTEYMFEQVAWQLVVAIADSQRQESVVTAQRMAAVGELLALRTAEIYSEDPLNWVPKFR